MAKQHRVTEDKQHKKMQRRAKRVAAGQAHGHAGGVNLAQLQQQVGNQAVQRLLAQRGGVGYRTRSPEVPIVQRDMPTDAEVEASMLRAGVQPRFPAIYGELMALAGERRYLSYEDWRRVTRNRDEAQRLFGQVLNQAWGVVQGEFLNYVIGRFASATVGAAITIITVADELMDEARWRRSRAYRENAIYLWLLSQLAMRIASAYRGYTVTEWDSRVHEIHQLLLRQTMNFMEWMDSYEARDFRRRALEARGEIPGVWYMYRGRR